MLRPLVLVSLFCQIIVAAVSAEDITWTSPAEGDIFGPGDTIIGKWTTAEEVAGASFRLCMSPTSLESRDEEDHGKGNCGGTVKPDVEQSEGVYVVSVYVSHSSPSLLRFLLMIDIGQYQM